MIHNRVSHELSEQDVEGIMEHLSAVDAEMPFLIGLEPAERKRSVKAGDKSMGFIRTGYKLGLQIEHHLPRSLDLEEMRKDIALVSSLYSIRIAAEQLAEKLRDTEALLTSEAYTAALKVYRTAKDVRGIEGLEETVKKMSKRFRGGRKKAKLSAPPTDSGE